MASRFSKNALIEAEIHDLIIVEPGPKELQIDIDSPEVPPQFLEQLGILQQFYGYASYRKTTSKSGNVHITVTLEKTVTATERIMLQALLGSDIKRELLTLKNYKEGRQQHQFFFEKKPAMLEAPKESLDSVLA
jgi:hypothetical protein